MADPFNSVTAKHFCKYFSFLLLHGLLFLHFLFKKILLLVAKHISDGYRSLYPPSHCQTTLKGGIHQLGPLLDA